MSYLSLDIETNAGQLEQDLYDRLAASFPDWEPADGNLEVFIARWLSGLVADLATITVDVSDEVFYRFGQEVHNVTPVAAASATVTSTWTMVDNAGYTIPAGTLVGIRTAGDELVAFEVLTTVVVDPGDTATSAGEVTLSAVVAGEEANDLSGTAELIDALDYVDSIVTVGDTANGADAETPEDYLDRLKEELGLLSRLVILPADAEVVSRRVAGVHRALALDLYAPSAGYRPTGNPAGNDLYDNERTLTVAVVDEDGEDLSNTVKDAVAAELALRREVGFLFYVINPTRTTVDVDVVAVAKTGYDTADVDAAIVAAVEDYLSPANWGIDQDTTSWVEQDTVYINELIALVDKVQGVERVTSVEIVEGGGTTIASNLALDGPASLTEPGAINASVS